MGGPDRPQAPGDRPALGQARRAADAEVGSVRADRLDRAAAHAEALEAVIAGTNDLALRISRDRAAIEERREQAARDAKQFRDRLAAVYADPVTAESAWAKLARENGLPGAVAAVTANPATLGALKGRRVLFGLIANRERADAIAAARHVPEAGAAAWNSAITRDLDRAVILTLDSWSRSRRVVGKAEWTQGDANPRYVVTSLSRAEAEARHLYETIYCARGEMENRIKECQADLFADRTSSHSMRSNQLRLWFASMAYTLVAALRRIALRHTQFANATCGTIRLKLLKIDALVKTSVRRIKIAMASAYPYEYEFRLAHIWLARALR
jgi:hypothetical protein